MHNDVPPGEDASPSVPSTDRWDVYFSGGGYRAAIAAVGVLYVVAGLGRWSSVRNMTSVSGGGIVNAAVAVAKPERDSDLTRVLGETFTWLTDRRRSARNVLAGVAVAAIPLAFMSLIVWWTLGSQPAWSAVLITFVVAAVGILLAYWAGVRVFLQREFRHLDIDLGSFDDADWFRSHIFVGSDLLRSRSVFVIVHRAIQWVVAPKGRLILAAQRMRLSTAVRASAAFPPALPPVNYRLPQVAASEQKEDARAPLWIVDGGATGNLGVQYAGGDALEKQLGPAWRARLNLAMAEDSLRRLTKQVDEIGRGISAATAYTKQALEEAERAPREIEERMARFRAEYSRRVEQEAPPVGSIDFDDYVKWAFDLGEQIRAEMKRDEPDTPDHVLARFSPFEGEPECGHDLRPCWSSCRECETTRIVVDASGPAPVPRSWEHRGLRLPGIANLITAGRTLRIEYEENLLADRSRDEQLLVSVVRSDRTYETSVGQLSIADEFLEAIAWQLSDTLLAGDLRGALKPIDYLRTRLADEASKMRTGLLAPTKRVADVVLASAVVNGFVMLGADDWDDLRGLIARLPADIQTRLSESIESTMQGFNKDKLRAEALLTEWVRELEPLRRAYAAAVRKRDDLRHGASEISEE